MPVRLHLISAGQVAPGECGMRREQFDRPVCACSSQRKRCFRSEIQRSVSENGNIASVALSSGRREVFWCGRVRARQPENLRARGKIEAVNFPRNFLLDVLLNKYNMIDEMANAFPFVKIPAEVREIVGEPTPGTRVFRRSGTSEECSQWFDALSDYVEPGVGVSPGGVSMFAPVSRAAVHHRLKNGMLTAFTFYVTEDEKSFFGTTRKRKSRPYLYIPVSECKAWAAELKRKAGVREDAELNPDERRRLLGHVEVPDGPRTGYETLEDEEFIDRDPKDKGNKKVVYKDPPMTREEIMFEIGSGMRFMLEDVLGKVLPGKLGEKHRERLRRGNLSYNYRTKKWSWEDGFGLRRKK